MAKQVWQSNSGRVFESKVEAEKDDVYHVINTSLEKDSSEIINFILTEPVDKVNVLLNALCELKRHNKYM